jgi:polyisoprenoid-binding protein YceI
MKSILAILLLLTAIPAFAQTRIPADVSVSTIRYSMIHPLHEWDGVSQKITSVIQLAADGQTIERVAVRVPVASFDSDNASRDSHMMEVAEALKFPDLKFGSTTITDSGSTLTVNGTLTFHGVDKPVTFTASKRMDNGKIRVIGRFPVKLTEFGIDPPRLLGIATEDSFTVSFDVMYSK